VSGNYWICTHWERTLTQIVRPSLFLVGAMKSGSTYLHQLLSAHPEIFMSTPKEPTYFVDQEQARKVFTMKWEPDYCKSEARYLSLFRDALPSQIAGESSQNYARLPELTGVPKRIHDFNPRSKIIYVMRDPVERTISHYWYYMHAGAEEKEILNAIRSRPVYQMVSYYAMQLKAYYEVFNRNQILTLTFESLRDDTEKHLANIYSWVGVDPTFIPATLSEAKNVTPTTLNVRYGVLQRLRETALYESVQVFVPRGVKRIGRTLSEKRIDKSKVPIDDVVAYLRPIQELQTRELSSLLNRKFPEWKTLYGDDAKL
jgi:Sulfotransferase family